MSYCNCLERFREEPCPIHSQGQCPHCGTDDPYHDIDACEDDRAADEFESKLDEANWEQD